MKKDNVIVTLACNDKYAEYAMVLIFSIYSHADHNRIYEIKLFGTGLTDLNIKRIESLTSLNFDVKVYDVTQEVRDNTSAQGLNPHISIDTYTRFFIVNHLQDYEKIIYLDIDMAVCSDISNLFDLDLHDKTIGATLDRHILNLYKNPKSIFRYLNQKISVKNYCKCILKLKQPYNYFQAGMLLIDIQKFNNKLPLHKALRLINKQFRFADQDILNHILNQDVSIIDGSWNVNTNSQNTFIHNNILHYAGPKKPWSDPHKEYADIWCSYARTLNTIKSRLLTRLAENVYEFSFFYSLGF